MVWVQRGDESFGDGGGVFDIASVNGKMCAQCSLRDGVCCGEKIGEF